MGWLRITLVVLVFFIACSEARGGGRSGGRSGLKFKRQTNFDDIQRYGANRQTTRKERVKTGKKPLLSAWGIIFLILFCIFIGVLFYYIYLFYPIYFKKQRQFENIELVNVKGIPV